MSYLKFSSNQFLEQQELNRFWKFIYNDGYRKHILDNTYSYGIIREKEDINFDNFKIKEGTNNGTIQIDKQSYAFDKDGNLIVKDIEDNINVPDDNQWYWVKVSHNFSPVEDGIVEIDSSGNVTAPNQDTEFTEVLRGDPNFPSIIKFVNASDNINEYQVLEVVDDFNLILNGAIGTFTAESNLRYKVIGTFTPDYIPSNTQKDIFQYDSVNLDLIHENPQGTQDSFNKPSKIPDKEFYIARIKRNGNNLIIQDKRDEFWKLKGEHELNKDINSNNPLVGLEAIKWDSKYSTRDKNIVEVGWGFRTDNFSWNASLNKISVSNGNGGIYKDVSDFNDNDFDGWRVYFIDGSYSKINSSNKNGNQIDLILDNFDPHKVKNNDTLVIVPDVEEIEFYVTENSNEDNNQLIDKKISFNIETGFAKIRLLALIGNNGNSYNYELKYRYKNFGEYSKWKLINGGSYYNEEQFDEEGNLKNSAFLSPYISSVFTVVPHPNSYFERINSVDTGDNYGINLFNLDNNNNVRDFIVGQNKLYQIVNGNDITLSADQIINISTQGAQEYNQFTFDVRGLINTNNNDILFTQDYNGQGNLDKHKGRVEITDVGNNNDVIEIRVKEYDSYNIITYKTIGKYKRDANDAVNDIAAGLAIDINDNTKETGYEAIANNAFVDLLAPDQIEPWKKPSNFDIDIQINGNIQAKVVNGFQGGDVLFKLSKYDLEKALLNKCIFNFYFDGTNWFINEEYRDSNPLQGDRASVTNDGIIVLNSRANYYYLEIGYTTPLIGIASDYHYEGDEITFVNGKYEDYGNYTNNRYANLRVNTYNRILEIIGTGFVTFKKRNGLWYTINAFSYLENRIFENEDNISNLQSIKANKTNVYSKTKSDNRFAKIDQENFKTASDATIDPNNNGWSDINFRNLASTPFRFHKDTIGYVHLLGSVGSGANSGSSGTIAITMPSNYKPYVSEQFFMGIKASEKGVNRVYINGSGEITIEYDNNTTDDDSITSLDGISYYAGY